jgi:hypothetical protein
MPIFPESLLSVAERVQTTVGQLRIVKSFASAHPAIEKLLQSDERRRKKALDIPYLSLWDGPVFQASFEKRRLLILNTLFLALSKCGASPSLRGREARELNVKVGDTHIPFTLDRPTPHRHKIRGATADNSRTPNDQLRLEISCWWDVSIQSPRWEDSDQAKIEESLSEIVVQILVSGERLVRHAAQQEYEASVHRQAVLAEEVRIRKERDEQTEREHSERLKQQRVDKLIEDAEAWRRAANIRAYVHAVVHAGEAVSKGQAPASLHEWVTWALREADRLDPISRQTVAPSALNKSLSD